MVSRVLFEQGNAKTPMQTPTAHTDTSGGILKTYWLQVRRARHWQNLEQYGDAIAALIATGETARSPLYEEVRLFEGRFDPARGKSEFLHLASLTRDSAQFAAGTADLGLNHTRLDLTGTCAPLTDAPAAAPPTDAGTVPAAPAPADETAILAAVENTSSRPPQELEDLRFDLLAAKARRPARPKQRRTALMTGVMAASFAVGALMTSVHPEPAVRLVAHLAGHFENAGTARPAGTLHDAILARDLNRMRTLLQAGADPNQRDAAETPALLAAARTGLPMTVDLLLEAGADPAAPVSGHRTVLHAVAEEGLIPPLRQMLKSGAPVDLAGGLYGCVTPLSIAAANGDADMSRLLTGFNASTEPRPGCTAGPVDFAAGDSGLLAELGEVAGIPEAEIAQAPPEQPGRDAQAAPDIARDSGLLDEMEKPAEPAPVAVAAAVYPENDLEDEAGIGAMFRKPAAYAAPIQALALQPRAPQRAEELKLLALQETGEVSGVQAFTTATPGAPMNLSVEEEHPRAPRKPAALINRDWFKDAVAETIENGSVQQLVTLLGSKPDTVNLASLAIDVESASGISGRTPLDYALLQGRPDHAVILHDKGIRPSPDVLHLLLTELAPAGQRIIAPVLGKIGIDPNARHDGKTALMRAAEAGDAALATGLLNVGADPSIAAEDGMRAAEIAAANGHQALQERLVIAADADAYTPILFGLTWSDTLDSVKPRTKTCKDVGDGFVACALQVPSALPNTAAVVAQFDTRNGNRLVAIQIDSTLFDEEEAAVASFDRAAAVISNTVPAGQFGFLVRELPQDQPMFTSLNDADGAAEFFQYWPDQNLSRSVYVHMKMIGYQGTHGFHRTVIGNPFRVG